VNPADPEGKEDDLARRLASFDEALKAGLAPGDSRLLPEGSSTVVGENMGRVGACLRLLEQAWPRGGALPPGALDMLPAGTAVGPYRIVERRGAGGMGVVYKALDTELGRLVALKFLRPERAANPAYLERFRREARAASALSHPHLCTLHAIGEHDGAPYLVMEWVEGGSLAERLDGTPLPARAAAGLLRLLARAVAHAHGRGVVHRDLKPANVLLAAGGLTDAKPQAAIIAKLQTAEWIPKIADFGLAKQLDVDQGQTQTGTILGTPNYMAPEQAAGRPDDIGPATDLWALGAILYELLTGRPPFAGSTLLETLDQVREHDPVPPGRLNPRVPRDLEVICLKCLNKLPADRYGGAELLADDLEAFLAGEPIRARSLTPLEAVVRAVRHHNLDGRTATVGTSLLVLGPLCLLAHLAAYGLWHDSPRFPEVITLVTLATLTFLPLLLLAWHRSALHWLPRQARRRLNNVWGANVVTSLLAVWLLWLHAPPDEPERLLLVYPVWLLLVAMGWFALGDELGLYYLIGCGSLAMTVVTALLPFWAPLIVAVTACLNMTVTGLFLRGLLGSGTRSGFTSAG
jgi:serine/threonine protein kinase